MAKVVLSADQAAWFAGGETEHDIDADDVRSLIRALDDPFAPNAYWRLRASGEIPVGPAKQLEGFLASAIAGEGGLPSLDRLEMAGY